MSDKVVVRFLKAWRGYSADELAGFDADVVDGLKSKGFAEVYEGEGGATSKQKAGKTPAAKASAGKSGSKSGIEPPADNTNVPPAGAEDGEGGDVTGGGDGVAGESREVGDDDEKP